LITDRDGIVAVRGQSERENSKSKATAALVEALTQLYELLEEYAPVWYTKEHHDKALAALWSVKKKRRSDR
jgi:hypothetical protein